MTEREFRLRSRIDKLTDERDKWRRSYNRLATQHGGKRRGACVYCGNATENIACASHRDLLDVDPLYEAA